MRIKTRLPSRITQEWPLPVVVAATQSLNAMRWPSDNTVSRWPSDSKPITFSNP